MGLLRPLHHLDTFIAGVVAIDRNQWSRSTGMPGRVPLESVVAIDRNTHLDCYSRFLLPQDPDDLLVREPSLHPKSSFSENSLAS
jgi:hypothetical protein